MSLWAYGIIAAVLLAGLWRLVLWLERHAGRPEDDPHQQAHGDVINPPGIGPPQSWRGP